jgi:hypothetical protein
VKERRLLLDDYLPEFDVRTSYAIRIAASPARVYASLWTADFDQWGVTRALYAVRTLPSFPTLPRETWHRFRDELFRQRFTLDGMLSEGFTLLEERPGEELVLQDQMRHMRHLSLQEQVNHLNQMLRGHYAYYGIAGNIQALQQVHRAPERYWRKMLSSRSWDGVIRWEQFQRIKEQFPLLRPKLYLPYGELQAIAIL